MKQSFLDTVLSRVVRVYVGDMPIEKQWKLLQEIPALRALPAFLKEIAHKKQEEMQKYAEELGQLDGQELYCFLDIILRDVLCYKKHQKSPSALWAECQREYHGYGGEVFLLDLRAVGRMYGTLQRRTGGECSPKLPDFRLLFVFIQYVIIEERATRKGYR